MVVIFSSPFVPVPTQDRQVDVFGVEPGVAIPPDSRHRHSAAPNV
jgi:hypothetical protein